MKERKNEPETNRCDILRLEDFLHAGRESGPVVGLLQGARRRLHFNFDTVQLQQTLHRVWRVSLNLQIRKNFTRLIDEIKRTIL